MTHKTPRIAFIKARWHSDVVDRAHDGFLAEQQRLIPGAFGIFGHGNVAGVGQALLQNAIDPHEAEAPLAYYQARNEQNMVHAAFAFSRTRNRLQTMACTASIGPGSTNMVTGAALATNTPPASSAAASAGHHDGLSEIPMSAFPDHASCRRTPCWGRWARGGGVSMGSGNYR